MMDADGAAGIGRRFGLAKVVSSLDWAGVLSILLLAVVLLAAVVGPRLLSFDPATPDLFSITKPPLAKTMDGRTHVLGTDQLGRDLLARIVAGARISMLISLSAALISATVGLFLGTLAGWFGGWVDELVMRLTDVQLAFPYILLILVLSILLPSSVYTVVFVLAIAQWPQFSRVLRGEILTMKRSEHVAAARSIGASELRIVWRHVLPNCVAPILVLFTFSLAHNIAAEAIVSFLGAGVPPTMPTWGRILAESRNYLTTSWWLATFPGLSITGCMLAINVLGDWLRDLLDPRIRDLMGQ